MCVCTLGRGFVQYIWGRREGRTDRGNVTRLTHGSWFSLLQLVITEAKVGRIYQRIKKRYKTIIYVGENLRGKQSLKKKTNGLPSAWGLLEVINVKLEK